MLDGVRAIAVLSIILFHVSYFSGVWQTTWWGRDIGSQLNIAVPIFFALSAFLLYRPFIAERAGGRRPATGAFFWRRALRILPAYWVVVVGFALYYGVEGKVFGPDWWVYFGMLGNYAPLYDPQSLCGGVVCSNIYWSLGTEVIFYALLPLYVFAMERIAARAGASRWLPVNMTVVLSLGLASVGVAAEIVGHPDARWVIYTLAANALYFAMGMLLAIVSVEIARGRWAEFRNRVERHSTAMWVAAAVVFALMCKFLSLADRSTSRGATEEYLLGALFVLLLLTPAVFPGEGRALPKRVLSNRSLAWVGLISYAVYLWHLIVISALINKAQVFDWAPDHHFAVLIVPAILASLAIGAASYYLLERPILRLKNTPPPWWRHRPARPDGSAPRAQRS